MFKSCTKKLQACHMESYMKSKGSTPHDSASERKMIVTYEALFVVLKA